MKYPSPRLLGYALLFQSGLIVGLLAADLRTPSVVTPAHAMLVPDPAAQQIQTNELLRGIDAKLSRIADTLASGELKVKVAAPPPERR